VTVVKFLNNSLILNKFDPTTYDVVPRVVIAAKTNSKAVSSRLDEHTELGWEAAYTHLKIKYLYHKGIINQNTIIVTNPGREFLYNKIFTTVLTSLPETSKQVLDLTQELQQYAGSGTPQKFLSFQSPERKCVAQYDFSVGYDLRSTINLPKIERQTPYVCATYRKREWGEQRNADDKYFDTIKEISKRHLVYLVGLEGKEMCNGTSIIYTSLDSWLSLSANKNCEFVIGTATGTMLLSWIVGGAPMYMLDLDNCLNMPNCCLHFRKENSFYNSTINKSFTNSTDFYNHLHKL
jgi:hypothetical protein